MRFARLRGPRHQPPSLRLLPPIEASSGQKDDELVSSRMLTGGLIAAVCIGAAVRLAYTLSSDFPLNDGGMFVVMTRDLQGAGYALPTVTSYNGADIPYAYPPLAFYVAAVLNDFGLSLESIFRIVPLIANVALIPAFFMLARRLLPSRIAVAASVMLFALVPRAFYWMIMGGGITRAFGFTFAVLALWAITAAYQDRRGRYVALAAVFGALTVLSHLQMAWFVGFSGMVVFAAYGRHRFGVQSTLAAAFGAALLSAPWWLTVILHHGPSPFVAAARAGDTTENPLTIALSMKVSGESLFPLIVACGLAGLVITLARRRYMLVAWLVAALLLDQRAVGTVASVPLALLGGVAAHHGFRALADRGPAGSSLSATPRWLLPSLCTIAVLYMFLSSLIAGGRLLGALSPAERDAMAWISESTPESSRVLVVTGDKWYADRTSEWFPYLAGRESVVTTQGYEWLAGGIFDERLASYRDIQSCASRVAACLDDWATQHDQGFEYVYMPRLSPLSRSAAGAKNQCCPALEQSLAGDARYDRVYDEAGAVVFRRLP